MNDVLMIVCPVLAEILLLFCGAFFASTETAYTAISRITVRQMIKDNEKHAKRVQVLKNNLDRLISTVLIGTNFVTALASSLATAFTLKVAGAAYVSYGTAVISIFVIIFTEVLPKTYAAVKTKETAQMSAVPVSVIQVLIFPIVWIFSQLTKFIELTEKIFIKKKRPIITEEEFKTLLELGENEGTLETDQKRMLDRIFEFSDLTVHGIMKHRSLIKYVNIENTLEEVIKVFADSGYSRIPVYEGTPENIVGVLHYKAVLFADEFITKSKDFIKICMRPVLFVPETFSAEDLLKTFKREHNNFAVAVDEYGSMAGIVTMDDILREVFGRMTDEYGSSELSPENRVTVISSTEFLVPGDLKIDDVNEVLNLNLDSSYFDTLGGWLLERFGELPSIGAVYKKDGVLYMVEDQSARRIQSVRIKFIGNYFAVPMN
ncbi:hemolysin family protein [Treponema sp.]|uniref:hemolysin family protein n=1 Tax=Treponema sp. TaxID=166 RepID=UPI00257B4E11|nr:hemolysin family protein [Treponema sp.]